MKEHNDDIHLKQLLHKKLEEHTVSAPDFVWPAIEKELFPPTKKRRPFFWWFVFSGLFLGTLSCFFLFPANHLAASVDTTAGPIIETIDPLQASASMTAKNESKSTTATNVIQNKQLVLSHHETKDSSLLSSNQPNQHLTNPAHGKTNRGLTDGVKGKKAGPNLGTKSNDSTNYSRPIHNSLIVETPGDKQTNTVILSSEHADSSNHLELSLLLLPAKTMEHTPDPIRLIHPNVPFPLLFIPYSFIDVYAGAGRNNRNYSGIVESNSHAFIIDRTLRLKNRNFGLDYNYQFLPFASFRIGINMGTNRYTTRLFPVRIANTDLNDELDISSPSGELRSAPLDLADQASPFSDTTTFLMRIIHRSGYISIPLSIRFNTTNAIGPQVYGYTGFDFVFRGKDQNTLIVRKSQTERSFSTSKPRESRGFYPGWHLGLGIATNPVRKLQLYGEFNYSQVLGNYYTGKVISIKSNNLQLNVGLRIKL
ncbi:MAG: hypothetical protein A3D31_15515 [Candidatus Fluviicola riflensis]|nr:MAG: hypothetical protein CHH17_00450 [Candidatus Fluviicola riflensis]OGS78367.1 MAG: hypothetical protein A3D31_15515 [Candidatus Fluviicola riflensis]OGS85433.1 MAG: hypothetical protein A2724_12450 [Fluviicola sp. RIFCSPHIGHO2_01_FULL_43_53]OGS87475.1 MAG: hypothetical protein A3E30_08870 [Fluviicola sp. RIFCSPHIGHO2_12_FULL_43_24]